MDTSRYWSVQRCTWERCARVADALATPWSVFAAAQQAPEIPTQRPAQGAPVPA